LAARKVEAERLRDRDRHRDKHRVVARPRDRVAELRLAGLLQERILRFLRGGSNNRTLPLAAHSSRVPTDSPSGTGLPQVLPVVDLQEHRLQHRRPEVGTEGDHLFRRQPASEGVYSPTRAIPPASTAHYVTEAMEHDTCTEERAA